MSSVTVNVICEGSTELYFIRNVLSVYMGGKNIFLHPSLIGGNGGNVRFPRLERHARGLLLQQRQRYVTTIFDYYGIAENWPGLADIPATATTAQKAQKIEKATCDALRVSVGDEALRRFIPYFSMHEFEGLLFTNVDLLAGEVDTPVKNLKAIAESFATPEDINSGPSTAPSKRILALHRHYDKVTSGTAVAKAIGIPAIRAKCPHFNTWLEKFEALTA